MQIGDVVLLENTRFCDYPEKLESKNDKNLANYWSVLGDVYVVEDGAEVTLADGKTSAKTPFDGTRLIFTAKKTGKYTIVYKAVDYSGVEVEKTFNVNVVAE